MFNKIIITIITFFVLSFSVIAAIDAYEFDSDEKAQEFRELTLQLRCPKCQNNSIGDSNAIISTDMRAKVYELMQQGYTKQQIIDYMIERYGNFVTYQPPVTAATIILWAGPLLFLMLGGIFIIKLSRRKSLAVVEIDDLSEQESERLKRLLGEDNTDSQRGNNS